MKRIEGFTYNKDGENDGFIIGHWFPRMFPSEDANSGDKIALSFEGDDLICPFCGDTCFKRRQAVKYGDKCKCGAQIDKAR